MRFGVALVCAGALSLLAFPAQANQMFRAGRSSGTSCPSGSQYRGSGFCRATKPHYQFFRAGGSSGTSCPSGSQYKGNGFCLARWAGLSHPQQRRDGDRHNQVDGTAIRTYLDQRDKTHLMWTILEKGRNREKYNVGPNEAISISQLADLERDILPPDKSAKTLGGIKRRINQ